MFRSLLGLQLAASFTFHLRQVAHDFFRNTAQEPVRQFARHEKKQTIRVSSRAKPFRPPADGRFVKCLIQPQDSNAKNLRPRIPKNKSKVMTLHLPIALFLTATEIAVVWGAPVLSRPLLKPPWLFFFFSKFNPRLSSHPRRSPIV